LHLAAASAPGPTSATKADPSLSCIDLVLPLQRYYSYQYYRSNEEATMRITTKGQVTIPQDIRERFGLLPHTEVEFVVEGETVLLCKANGENHRMRAWLDQVRGSADITMTTDEIMRLTRGED
jgi:AbrB family looped-hinge helix DNA binding protein